MRLNVVPALPLCQVGQRVPIDDTLISRLNQYPGVYVLLTADHAHNEGMLIDETISGSGATLQAVATVDYAKSGFNGRVIHLINTEGAFLRPQESSGIFKLDQMQRITGNMSGRGAGNAYFFEGRAGAFTLGGGTGPYTGGTSGSGARQRADFNSANSPNARVSSNTAGETRPKFDSDPFILRIF